MSVREQIEEKLRVGLSPERMELVNESHRHRVPAGSESHWNLIIVASSFNGQSLVDRHRAIHGALGPELQRKIHALTIKALTPEQWRAAGAVDNPAPPCLGGSKAERRRAGG